MLLLVVVALMTSLQRDALEHKKNWGVGAVAKAKDADEGEVNDAEGVRGMQQPPQGTVECATKCSQL